MSFFSKLTKSLTSNLTNAIPKKFFASGARPIWPHVLCNCLTHTASPLYNFQCCSAVYVRLWYTAALILQSCKMTHILKSQNNTLPRWHVYICPKSVILGEIKCFRYWRLGAGAKVATAEHHQKSSGGWQKDEARPLVRTSAWYSLQYFQLYT